MLYDSWPGVYWNLYDYFLRINGSYYGKIKACKHLLIQYGYDDCSKTVVNSYLKEFRGLGTSVRILIFDLRIRLLRRLLLP